MHNIIFIIHICNILKMPYPIPTPSFYVYSFAKEQAFLISAKCSQLQLEVFARSVSFVIIG